MKNLLFISAFLLLSQTNLQAEDYHIGVGDVLEIKVFGESEFTGLFKVGNEGNIEYPYIRKIKAQGKTRDEITQEITTKLKDGYLIDPQVSVDIKEFRSQKVQLVGAVGRPGGYFLEQETTILSLISRAGGIIPGGGKRLLLLRNLGKTKSTEGGE